MVTEATRGATHQLHVPFCSGLSFACLKFDEASKNHVYAKFEKDNADRTLSKEIGCAEMMKKKEYKVKIKNYVPSPSIMISEIHKTVSKIANEDQRLRAEAVARGEGYRSYFLKPVAGIRRGTHNEVKNLEYHVQRLCCADPLPCSEMNVPTDPDDDYPDYLRMRSTSQGEAGNKNTNHLVKDVPRQASERGDKRMWLACTRINLNKDRKLQKVLNIKQPRTFEWYFHEALLERNGNISAYRDLDFPCKIPEGYDEPIGAEYGRYREWDHIQTKIDRMVQLNELETIADQNHRVSQMQETGLSVGQSEVGQLGQAVSSHSQNTLQYEPTRSEPPEPSTTSTATPSSLPNNSLFRQEQSSVTEGPPVSQTEYSLSRNGLGQADFGPPRSVWARRLGEMSRVSTLHEYLNQSVRFTNHQSHVFWTIVAQVYAISSNPTLDGVAIMTKDAWNRQHIGLMSQLGTGLGGLMRMGHAIALLKENGQQCKSARLGIVRTSPVAFGAAKAPPVNSSEGKFHRFLRRHDIGKLSHRDTVPWLIKIGAPQHRGKEERKEALRAHFMGKSDDYVLTLP